MKIFTKIRIVAVPAMIYFGFLSYAYSIDLKNLPTDVIDCINLQDEPVFKKGASDGIVSEIDGNYTITPDQGGLLLISNTGYLSREIVVVDLLTLNDLV